MAKVTQLVVGCGGVVIQEAGLCQPGEQDTLAIDLFLGQFSKNPLVTSQNKTNPPKTLKLF